MSKDETSILQEVGSTEKESLSSEVSATEQESTIAEKPSDTEAESGIAEKEGDNEAESDLSSGSSSGDNESPARKTEYVEDLQVENDATVGGTLRAHKLITDTVDTPKKGSHEIYNAGGAYKHSATHIGVDDSQQATTGVVGLTLRNADNEALGMITKLFIGLSDKDKQDVFSGVAQLRAWIENELEQLSLKYLSKVKEDTAAEVINFLKGLTLGDSKKYGISEKGKALLSEIVADYLHSDDFKQGYMGGSGFGTYKKNGRSYVETDNLIVRMKAVFAELEIRKLSYVGGDQVKSFAGSVLAKVIPIDIDGNEVTDGSTPNAYKCYFINDDGTTRTENWWKVGDQARCQTFDIKTGVYHDVSNRYYWRLVTEIGEGDVAVGTDKDGNTLMKHMGYVVLSNVGSGFTLKDGEGNTYKDETGNDIVFIGYDTSIDNDAPAAEDKIVQMGSQNEPDRSYAIIDFVTEQRTSYYYGINGYSLAEYEVMRLSPFDSWVYTQFFEMRVGEPNSWHPPTNYRGAWDSEISYTFYNTVTHDGLLWMHNKRGYVSIGDEPSIYSDVWTLVTGGGDMKIEFYGTTGIISSRGCDVTLEAHLTMAGRDITDTMLKNSLNVMTWTRNSGIPSEDKAWTPTLGTTGNILLISHHEGTGRTDLGSQWLQKLKCEFTFTLELKNKLGTESQMFSASIPVQR